MTKPDAAILDNRAFLFVRGPDAEAFLQNIVSQDVATIALHDAAFACLLTPQGKILFDFFVIRDEGGFIIDCFAEAAPALLKRLSLYKLRADVTLAPLDDWAAAVVLGETPIETPDSVQAFPDPRLAALGQRIVSDRNSVDAALTGATVLTSQETYRAYCVAHGIAEFGPDFNSEEMFPMDVNYDALNGVNYQKGCFVGQEVASRMKRKGEVRKRTLVVAYDGAAPDKGEAVMAGPSKLGDILSTANGHALAMIRLDRWEKSKANSNKPVIDNREVRLTIPDYLNRE